MSNNWEDKFVSWAKGPGQNEQDKCENAERAVKKAIDGCKLLSSYGFNVFAQGSYCVRTNVRANSDVDVCVRLNNPFFAGYPLGKKNEDFGNSASDLKFSDFKKWVGDALVDYFGAASVASPGKKAFDVHANTYRVDADVIATLEYREYTGRRNPNGTHHYIPGVAFVPDGSSDRIVNWPQQTYDNGVTKNEATGRHYKRVIRILKRLRNEMQEAGIASAKDVNSFLIEGLVWNVPNEKFNHLTYTEDIRSVLIHCYNPTLNDQSCSSWHEVNEIKQLFSPDQPWTREKANNFILAAWRYSGFK